MIKKDIKRNDMKKTLIIATLLLSLACQGQEKPDFWHRPFWHNFTVGAEFAHTMVRNYEYPSGIFRNHPNNSANLVVSYDLNRVWTLSAYLGYCGCHLSSEHWRSEFYTPEWGTSSEIILENYPALAFGLEGTLHVLPLLYRETTLIDLTLNARAAKNPQDLDLGGGIGVGYTLPWGITLYGKAYYGSFSFPIGMQENGLHFQLVFGAKYRL
jgi:hypothetical protein